MNEASERSTVNVRVWEWPFRAWHWLFAVTITASLTTGLAGDIGWMEWHLRFGYVACGLLLFRVVWGFAGGLYSRWSTYRTSPGRVLSFIRRVGPGQRLSQRFEAHTPPGVLLALTMLLVVLVQAGTGLFATDDIFIEGPFMRYADDEVVETLTALHHRVWYLVIAAVAAHITAQATYGLRRNPLPLAMITGSKRLPPGLGDTPSLGWRGVVVGLVSAGLVWVALTLA
ncbi:MAG: cytochrome b/b6 domain-containing protein [Pseudomonadales bacterium]